MARSGYSAFGPSATIADLYANNIRIERVCIAAALYNLGIYVGVTEEILCADTSLSPFFWSSTESADDVVNAICTVQGIFNTLKPDLRPNSEQITIKHHPYMDILPFPTLRKNLITYQEKIDEDEFFQAIFTGLVCWGGAGIGRKDREDSTDYASTGTPWDVRSREARVWVLQKYWTLLGGEGGELVRQNVGSLIPETDDTEKRDRAKAAGFELGCELVNHSLKQCLIGIRSLQLLIQPAQQSQ